jgi:arsenite methyltransferase
VDCVIRNCVINLAADKKAVFREIARVLKPGGRLAVSDIALKRALPSEIGADMMAYAGCIAGAISIDEYRQGLIEAGFGEVLIIDLGADLNAYRKVEGQSPGCVAVGSESAGSPDQGLKIANATGCYSPEYCGSADDDTKYVIHRDLDEPLSHYNVNDYAVSVKVFAVVI